MAEAPPKSLPLIQSRYRIEAMLGQTRLAAVYRATDERLQRSVLVHLLRKDLVGNMPLRQRFVDECRASASRSHSALLEVFDSGEAGERPFMVTEYATGRALREIGALSPDEALLYARQVFGAVNLCQTQNLPHPPISSANVILVEPGRVKLVESWQVPPDQLALDLAHYRAPERTLGGPPTPAGTVYALGLLLFEMLSGTRPFPATTPQEAAQAHLAGRVPPLAARRPGLYLPSIERLLARATAPQPEQRFATVAELGQALDATRSELLRETQRLAPLPNHTPLRNKLRQAAATLAAPAPVSAPAEHPAGRARQQPTRRGWGQFVRVWLVLLTLVGTVVFGGWWLANTISRQLQGAEPPRVTVPNLPTFDWRGEVRRRLPEWLQWAVPEPEAVLIVNAQGLFLRPEPGTNNTPLAELPGGTRVTLLEGPVTLDDGSQWGRVRSEPDGHEGWVSLKYLKPE